MRSGIRREKSALAGRCPAIAASLALAEIVKPSLFRRRQLSIRYSRIANELEKH
jgi:hypothetical protein